MGRRTEKDNVTCSKRTSVAKSIATFFLVTTGLELCALPLLCYEFAFRERVFQGQLAQFRGDPNPGPLAAALPRKILDMHERMLSCVLYTGFAVVKQVFNIVLLIGHRKNDRRLLLAWVWGFSAMHAASSAITLWFGARKYYDLDIVAALAILYVAVISTLMLIQSSIVLVKSVRMQRRVVAVPDGPTC